MMKIEDPDMIYQHSVLSKGWKRVWSKINGDNPWTDRSADICYVVLLTGECPEDPNWSLFGKWAK